MRTLCRPGAVAGRRSAKVLPVAAALEARHYQDYLDLAQKIAGEDISERVRQLGEAEAALILRPEAEFRFHSGVPVAA